MTQKVPVMFYVFDGPPGLNRRVGVSVMETTFIGTPSKTAAQSRFLWHPGEQLAHVRRSCPASCCRADHALCSGSPTGAQVFVGCSGSFRFDHAVRDVHPTVAVHSNDVSLLSCSLGALATGASSRSRSRVAFPGVRGFSNFGRQYRRCSRPQHHGGQPFDREEVPLSPEGPPATRLQTIAEHAAEGIREREAAWHRRLARTPRNPVRSASPLLLPSEADRFRIGLS